MHMEDLITIDEANWEDAALEDIDLLMESEPLINPEWTELNGQFEQMNAQHEQAKVEATQLAQSGQIQQEHVDAGQQLEQQVEQMKQQLQKTPKYLSSIQVADDESQDHETISATVQSWMGEPKGRSLRKRAEAEQEGGENWKKWTNVFLYWQKHKEVAGKFTKAQSTPPRVSFSGKLTPNQQAQLLLMAAGVSTNENEAQMPNESEVESIQRSPFAEIKTRTRRRL